MFSNDKNIETIGQLVEVIKHYLSLQGEYVKLDVVDKVVRLLTVITITAVVVVLLLLALIYLSFAAAFAMAPALGMILSFCIVGAVYVVALLLVLTFRHRWIERPLVKFLAGLLLSPEDKSEEL